MARSWLWFLQETAPCSVAVESWQWIHQVAAPCNVTRGSRMTCHWIRPLATPRNVTRSCGIVTLNSSGGSTQQCGRWLWDDRPLNSPKRLPYWNSASGFDLDHVTAVNIDVILHQSAKFYPIGQPSAEKNDVMWIFKMADLWILGSNNGFFEKRVYDFL